MISVSSNIANLLRKQAADEKACWKGYTQVGMKMKGGREVPNCVPAKDVPKPKAKAEKKAYGHRDDYHELDRWADGGVAAGLPKDKAVQAIKLLGDIAAKHQLKVRFRPEKYYLDRVNFSDTSYNVAQAIKAVKSDSDEPPNYYELESLDPNKKVKWNKFDADLNKGLENLMKDHVWDNVDGWLPKQSAAKNDSSFSSESILDVPIKCTPGFGCKRYFTPQEEAEIESASGQMWPALFPSKGDAISSQLSSPGWSFLGHGALGALLGAGAGGGFASISQKHIPLAIALGGLVGGLGGGIYGAATKNRKNKEIINLMQELPVGADIGDVELFNDPRLKAQMARDFQRQLIRKGLME